MAGYNFSQNIIGLNKTNGDIHELEVEVANLSASVLSISEDVGEIAEDVQEIALEISQLSASTLPYSETQSTKQKIDEIDEDIIVFEFSTSLNFVQNTWSWQTLSVSASQTIPTGYKVVSVFATTNYPHADLVIPSVQEGKTTYGYMTYSSRTVSDIATIIRAVCKKI